MSNPRYPEEFKIEAVKQVAERGLPVVGGIYTQPICLGEALQQAPRGMLNYGVCVLNLSV